VRAPGHADRVEKTRQGWAVEFGANHFLAGKAIERCRSFLLEALEAFEQGKPWSRAKLVSKLKTAVAWSVANYSLDEYELYPLTGNDMMFGAQSIDVEDAASFMIKESGITEFLAR
jgi:hypothetical protein